MDLKIIEFVREHGRVSMADVVRVTGANRNTLKVRLRGLVEKGHLVRHGAGKGAGMGWGDGSANLLILVFHLSTLSGICFNCHVADGFVSLRSDCERNHDVRC
jgi:hypothetical protein